MTFRMPKSMNAEAPNFKGLRLGKKNIEALEVMAYEGLSLNVAADRLGIRRANLQRAFDLPKVRSAFNSVTTYIRSNAAHQAYLRINHLSQTAKSEQVRLKAAEWLCGVDNIAPTKRVERRVQHDVAFGGFVVDLSDDDDVAPIVDTDDVRHVNGTHLIVDGGAARNNDQT